MSFLRLPLQGHFGALLRHGETRNALRYLVVTIAGYAIDFGISIATFKLFGLPLTVAAAIGFFVAATANYASHEIWTFSRVRDTNYHLRLTKYIAVSLVTLAVRTSFIFVVEPFAWSDLSRVALLMAAAGLSLIANYLLSRFFVFK